MARAAYDKCFRTLLGADYQSLKLTILLSCGENFHQRLNLDGRRQ
jgi:hypothetical protein